MFAQKAPESAPTPAWDATEDAAVSGPISFTLENHSELAICAATLQRQDYTVNDVSLRLPGDRLEPGQSLTRKVGSMELMFAARSCHDHSDQLHTELMHIRATGPVYIAIGGAPTDAPPGAVVANLSWVKHVGPGVMEQVRRHKFRSSSAPAACKPAGDTSALSGTECCSGTMTSYSQKHPGPSHCSYPDE